MDPTALSSVYKIGLRFAYLRSCVTSSLILVWIEGSSTPSTLLDLLLFIIIIIIITIICDFH
jgi:hypothetical protein